jgi:hypothetical protein
VPATPVYVRIAEYLAYGGPAPDDVLQADEMYMLRHVALRLRMPALAEKE